MNFRYYKSASLVVFILVLSVACGFLSDKLEALVPANENIKKIWSYIDVFSTVSLITLILTFINHVGWKLPFFKWLIDIPDLNGRYKGSLESSYPASGANTRKECVLEIRQTASSIKIRSYYGDVGSNNQTSQGYSIVEELVNEDSFFRLYHIFVGVPDPLQTSLHKHDGTSSMVYIQDKKQLTGGYYNERPNKGTMTVTFQQKKLLGRLRD